MATKEMKISYRTLYNPNTLTKSRLFKYLQIEQQRNKDKINSVTTIYFLLDKHHSAVKIGASSLDNVEGRVKSIKATNLNELTLLKIIKVTNNYYGEIGCSCERSIHWVFKKLRIRNEWFKYEETLKEFIGKL